MNPFGEMMNGLGSLGSGLLNTDITGFLPFQGQYSGIQTLGDLLSRRGGGGGLPQAGGGQLATGGQAAVPPTTSSSSNPLSDAYNWLMSSVTGSSMADMANMLHQQGNQYPYNRINDSYPGRGNFDKRLHALSSYKTADRFGAWPSRFIGYAKEALDLPFGEGLDGALRDLAANEYGVNLYQRRP